MRMLPVVPGRWSGAGAKGWIALAGLLLSNLSPVAAVPFGGTLDARTTVAHVAADAEFGRFPVSCELWCKLTAASEYNILIAHHLKSSPTHWELFTTPGDGRLTAYLPGFAPDTPRTSYRLVDNQWHHVALVLEPARLRLWVDGQPQLDQALRPPTAAGTPGELALGGLVDDQLGCTGWLDEVRLSRGGINQQLRGRFVALTNTR